MLCLWSDFGEEQGHNITTVLKEWKQLKFVIWDEMRLSVSKRKTKYTKLNLKLKVIFTCVIRIHFLVYQLSFVSSMSSIVQFTFIVSFSICPCIKINADAVGLHVTQVFTEPRNCYFYGANCVVYEAFPLKCLLRSKLQITTLVRDADTFEMEIIIHQMQHYCLCWYVENYGKLGRWYFIIGCVRLEFFSSAIFSIL